MKPDIPTLSSEEACSSMSSGGLQHFLFTDDYNFSRALIRFLSSRTAVRRFVVCGLAIVGIGLIALVVTMAAPLRGWRMHTDTETAKTSAVRSGAATDVSGNGDLSDVQTASQPATASSDDRNYTLAMLDPEGGRTVSSSDGRKTAAGQTTAGSSSASQFAHSIFGGGGGGGGLAGGSAGFGGGVGVSSSSNRGVRAANPVVAAVPESGQSIVLLFFGLTAVGVGRLWSRRSRSRIGR